MLQNTKELYGHQLAASDGEIGLIQDFYFDDHRWVVRYLIADTGTWLSGRLVLISPHAFGRLDQDGKTLSVNLTRAQIENGPSIESHQPVSRQYEIDYYRYYGWQPYWNGGAMWGLGASPVLIPAPHDELEEDRAHHHRTEKNLRSAKAVKGYTIHATDGDLGQVKGFMVDDTTWAVSALAVEAGHWYAGKEILIPTAKVTRISYEDSEVFVNLSKADIERTGEHEVAKAMANSPRPGAPLEKVES